MNKAITSICALLLLASICFASDNNNGVVRSVKPDNDWLKKNLPAGFGGNAIAGGVFGDNVFVLYVQQKEKKDEMRFSHFINGNEKTIWTHKDPIPIVASGFISPPEFVLCDLNKNKMSDCLITYTVDEGIANAAECWTKYLVTIVDGELYGDPLVCAKSDLKINRDEPDMGKCSSDIGVAYQKEGIVVLMPSDKNFPSKIYIMNRTAYFEDSTKKVFREQYTECNFDWKNKRLLKSLVLVEPKKEAAEVVIPKVHMEPKGFEKIDKCSRDQYIDWLLFILGEKPVVL